MACIFRVMCFASAPSTPRAATPDDYEFVDSAGTVVPESTKGATRRLRLRQYESIMFSGNDGSGDPAGTNDGTSAEGPGSGTW